MSLAPWDTILALRFVSAPNGLARRLSLLYDASGMSQVQIGDLQLAVTAGKTKDPRYSRTPHSSLMLLKPTRSLFHCIIRID